MDKGRSCVRQIEGEGTDMFDTKVTRLCTWLAGVVLALAVGLGGCGNAPDTQTTPEAQVSEAAEQDTSEGEGAKADGAEAATEAEAAPSILDADGAPIGKPWVSSNLIGNLPDEAPALTDDLYTHFDFDWLKEHQDEGQFFMTSTEGELQAALVEVLADESRDDHTLQQMRILYGQASDLEALKEIGFSEVQPYIDQIDAVSTIEELNELVTSRDFPFTPFVMPLTSSVDTREDCGVEIYPNLLFVSVLLDGSAYYQDTDDAQTQQANEYVLKYYADKVLADCSLLGITEAEASGLFDTLYEFERSHARCYPPTGAYLASEYGAFSKMAEERLMSLGDLCAYCPHVPMAGMLDACGKGDAHVYGIASTEWLEALDALWCTENLDALKLVAKVKVLDETRPFRDPSVLGESERPDAETHGYEALDTLDTFSHALAETYVSEVIGEDGQRRIRDLAAELVSAYSELIGNTAWLSEESEALVREKLDHMTLNILAPAGGYMDYDGVELKATADGGTLFSNYLTLKRHRQAQEAKLLAEPSAAGAIWYEIEPTFANAFYDAASNSINILPGDVTSAVFSPDMTDAELMARLGWTIAHEISHAFDYIGSQMDAYGRGHAVFSEDDVEVFLAKSQALADYFSVIEYAPGRFVDGVNVQGEAAADLCGTQAILEVARGREGFDYEAFFREFAKMWAATLDEQKFLASAVDVHPLPNLRVNVCSQMFDAIYDELGVSEGDGMYLAPEERINIWGEDA